MMAASSSGVLCHESNLPPVSYGLLSNDDYIILRRFFRPSSQPHVDYGDSVNILLKIGKLDVYLPRKLFERFFPIFSESSSLADLSINENPIHFFQMIKCLFPCPDCQNVDETNVFYLLELCKFHISNSVNEQNWTKYLTLARKLRLKYLAAFVIRRAASFPYEVLKSVYEDLPSIQLSLILDARISVLENNMNFVNGMDVTVASSFGEWDLSPESIVLEDAMCRQCHRHRTANVHSSYAFLYTDEECSCFKIRHVDDILLLAYLKPIATNLGPKY
uniref:BTB domain-containing protein n=1 Tax=Romanomermis culicivorax TaxID=13658 RepID=A0A915JJ53_ROMCU